MGEPGFPLPLRAGCASQTLPPGGGMGKPGFPLPLRTGCALPNPPAGGGMGKPGSPSPCVRARPSRGQGRGEPWFPHTPALAAYVHVRRSCAWRTPPRCTCPRSAGVPPASRLRGHGDAPLHDPPSPGAGTRLLPPAGGGWEEGCTRRTMVTSAVHAAPPRTDGMNILPGRAQPSQTLPGAGAWVRGPPARVR